MGRRPLPAGVVELRGNPSRLTPEQIEKRRDQARPATAEPPDDLTRFEAQVWKAHAPELARLGMLSVLDTTSFLLNVVTPAAIALEARQHLRPSKRDGTPDKRRRELGIIVPDRKYGGQKRHPALSVLMHAAKEYRQGCAAFGLTPLSRVALPAPVDDHDDDADLFDA